MRVDLAGLLNNAADAFARREAGKFSYYEFALREAADHVRMVQKGEADLSEFADLYCLTKKKAS